ncbi:MAG: type II secretion system protein GspG [Kiritimatiellia bacterium]
MQDKLNAVATALDMFKTDHDRFPATLDELLPATNGLGGGALSGYIRPEGLIDSWGQRFNYSVHDNEYELRSAGPDGTFQTADDIVRTEK